MCIPHTSGPGCIKQLKIKWEFMQPFPVCGMIFLDAIMDKSAVKGLLRTRTMRSITQGTVVEIPT